jgi:hypothetical protein
MGIVNLLLELFQHIRWHVVTGAFCVDQQQPNLAICEPVEIHHTHATAFTGAFA